MIRTLISLDPDDKSWLARKAQTSKTTIAALVRQAVKQMRSQDEIESPSFNAILDRTQGIWQGEDGLSFQQSLRDEWS